MTDRTGTPHSGTRVAVLARRDQPMPPNALEEKPREFSVPFVVLLR